MRSNRVVKFSWTLFIVLIGRVSCEDDVKVMEINGDTNVTHIRFANNGSYVSPKASAVTQRVAAYDPQMIGQCGGIYRNIQSLVESPKFISARPICSLRCEYQIISPYVCENEFHVQFLEFSMDASEGCVRDRVIINHDDELCGKVVGAKKYRTEGGVLNITFSAASWDSNEKGFRLLVTRLPCVDDADTDANQTETETTTEVDGSLYHVTSSFAVESPTYENQHPIYGVPSGFNSTEVEVGERQDIPVITLPPPTPIYPPVIPPPPPPVWPPPPQQPFPPPCCRNIYNQPRFLLLSQGFPAFRVLNNDCAFVIHKSTPNSCRLRIHFKYFLLDDVQQQQPQYQQQQQQVPGQWGCLENFIEIDGQRICGCKTELVLETQFGLGPKIIRLHTAPGSYFNAQGFVLDVEQLDCPFKLEAASNVRTKRTLFTTLLLKKHLLTSHLSPPLPPPHHLYPLQHRHHSVPPIGDIDGDDAFRVKFFNSNYDNGNGFVNSLCSINHLRLLQLKIDSLAAFKHHCLPPY